MKIFGDLKKLMLLIPVSIVAMIYFYFMVANDSKMYELKYNRFLTWEIPGFAYMSNQMVLHYSAITYNPFSGRKLVSPGIRFPAIQGVPKKVVLPLEDVYEITPELSQFYELPTPENVSFVNYTTVRRAFQHPEEPAIRILNEFEDFWYYMFLRFKIAGLTFKDQRLVEHAKLFKFKEPIPRLKKLGHAKIKKSIAVHMRTFATNVTLGSADPCADNGWYDPRTYIYSCYTVFEEIFALIEREQLSEQQPIYVATDNLNHTVLKQLIERYEKRIFLMDDFIDWDNVDFENTSIPHAAIPALLENELLVESDIFIGNYWSTYSNIVALKRNHTNTVYVYDLAQRVMLILVLVIISLSIIAGLLYFIFRRM